jgi:two-component system, chemotaxis family, CheB/CheR fusion protein
MSKSDRIASAGGRLVVVGSSAGGIEALSVLVSALPSDFPAPIVLAQHLDPRQHSRLGAILQRRTTLPVQVVKAHTLLRAGEIYAVPENRDVTINDGFIEAREDRLGRPKPSLDLLLSSAAAAYGERLIAVILTGSGSNGALGAIEVKRAGGIVIIQNPQTARFPSMPLALPPTIVDLRADIERIGPLLSDLLTGRHLPQEGEQDAVLARLLDVLTGQERLDVRRYKPSTLLDHIGYRMLATGTPRLADYLAYVQAVPEEVEELTKALLVTYTEFFRDPGAFAYLKETLLPELIERARERDHTLRCWSAGCATGEEAYSLAMLLTELLGEELPQWRIRLFATDLSEEALSFARRGVYPENLLKGVPPEYRARFFEPAEHGWRVVKHLRQVMVFGQQDLARTVPFSAIDLVLCRNVLSSFLPQTQEVVLNQFAFSLYPGGYLLLGKDEPIRPEHALFAAVSRDWHAYRCIGKATPSPRFPAASLQPRYTLPPAHPPLHSAREQPAESPLSLDLAQLSHYTELLFRALPIGLVVLEHGYRIMTANNIVRRLLRLPATAVEQDFLHAVPSLPYAQVRRAIDAAFRERSAITLPEVELDILAGGSGRIVALSVAPIQLMASQPELVAIAVVDLTEQVLATRHLEAVQAEQVQLVNELGATNKRLTETNQALQKANEEMILTQEELQARLEELETVYKALQASFSEMESDEERLEVTSQEMEATNEELRTTAEMLESANAELTTRAGVLQAQNDRLTDERRRLDTIVEQVPFSFVLLGGPELRVEAVSSHYTGRLHGQSVLGLPLAEVAGRLWSTGPLARLAGEVYREGVPRILPAEQTGGEAAPGRGGKRHPAYTLSPVLKEDGTILGVIISATGEAAAEEQAGEPGRLDPIP